VWNLRYPDAVRVADDDVANELVEEGANGPLVAPGTYRVRLQVGDRSFDQTFEIRRDARVSIASDADLRAQSELLLQVRDKLSEVHTAVNGIRALRRRAEDWASRGNESVSSAAKALVDALEPIEGELLQAKAKSKSDTLNLPMRLNGKLASLAGVIGSADGPPTRSARQVLDELSARVAAHMDALRAVESNQVLALNEAIAGAGLSPVAT